MATTHYQAYNQTCNGENLHKASQGDCKSGKAPGYKWVTAVHEHASMSMCTYLYLHMYLYMYLYMYMCMYMYSHMYT